MKLSSNYNGLSLPENLEISMKIRAERESNTNVMPYHNFILGQSPFPVPNEIQEALADNSNKGMYSPFYGLKQLTKNIIEFNKKHFDLTLNENQVIFGYGTKHLMQILVSIIEGHYFVPVPAWVGYLPIIKHYKRDFSPIRLKNKNHWKLTAGQLENHFSQIDTHKVLIFNNPHNPTGAVYTLEEMNEVVEVCRKYDVTVISDEIYALMTYEIGTFVSMAKIFPENTFVTNGISKDRSAAGYRFGTCILPTQNTDDLQLIFRKYISNFFTNISTPIQYAAIKAYSNNESINHYIQITRKIHHYISKKMYSVSSSIKNIDVSYPEGGFYLTLDLNKYHEKFIENKIYKSSQLVHFLLENPIKVSTISGESIGLRENDYLLRIAFVDYDGEKLLNELNYGELDYKVIDRYVEPMILGIKKISQFLEKL